VLRTLVINADDLGLTIGVNNGIFDLYDCGALTSASIFANAPATVDAIGRIRNRRAFDVGAHLTLIDGLPTLPPHRIPTLVAGDGRFRASWRPFIVSYVRGRISLDEVERELTAQIDRLRSEGIRLTHLDGHRHIHAFPPLFALVARLAVRFGIPVVRVPYERGCSTAGDEGRRRRIARRQLLANAAMLPWAWRDYRIAAAHGIRTPQFIGRVHAGVMTASTLVRAIRRLRPGHTELMVHPGYVDTALNQTATRMATSRADEIELLSGTAIRATLAAEQVQLVSHHLRPIERPTPSSFGRG
jgi:predicted glycoside hydrolase/deacetylase ChbG (UPF0249 family)